MSIVLDSPGAQGTFRQGTFDELGRPLAATTFVVVDLETTGGSPAAGAGITEVGAVKVRGGEVLGEFQTLVRPGEPIPPFIAVLTGITDAMVAGAPRIQSVLPAFLEFAQGSVLVAHNAPFDVGFLRAAAIATEHDWPGFDVVDTARLARRVLLRDEAPNCKLSTLARVFRARVTPNHRALTDAQATVDVLHGLIERLGNQGVHTLEELSLWQSAVSPAQRRKRHLAEGLPHAPGVYVFRDAEQRPLYVGKSRDLRTRVRNYFTASETRTRMTEMVGLATEVVGIVCATPLEAEVRELRLIAEHKPRYNRRSRFPERAMWVKLTDEPFPRLSLVREVREDAATYLGPFNSRRQAEQAMTAVHEALPLRQCTTRLTAATRGSACVLAELGRCGAPCTGAQSVDDYALVADAARQALTSDARPLVTRLLDRIRRLAAGQRFEDAALHRDRLAAFIRAADRVQRVGALSRLSELVAALRRPEGGWELHVVRHGRLAGASMVPHGADPRPYVDTLRATAEAVRPAPAPLPAATVEEAECILRWLDTAGVRLVEVSGDWTVPAHGAGSQRGIIDAVETDRRAADPFADRRGLRPTHQPAR